MGKKMTTAFFALFASRVIEAQARNRHAPRFKAPQYLGVQKALLGSSERLHPAGALLYDRGEPRYRMWHVNVKYSTT